MAIFKAYDVRGIVPEQLNEDIAEKIGKAFATVNPGAIAVGMDARLSSPMLKKKIIKGLFSSGADVVDIGIVSTPMLIFSVGHYKHDGGIMITGSHTPKNYNGFKFYTKDAVSVSYETGINKIEKLVKTEKFVNEKGSITKKNIKKDYTNFILKNFNFKNNNLKIIIDGCNGSAGKIYSDILRKTGFDIVELFCEPDGNFPDHDPDPMKYENLKKIREKVVKEKADLGFAYDGDGDRLTVIKNDGSIADSNKLYVVLARHILSNNKGANIVHDTLCSKMIEDMVKKLNGNLIICRVGHSYIAQKMAIENCIFAGELSGHYFFRETFNQDDVLFASLKLLEFLVNNNTTLEKEFVQIPDYHSEVSETNRVEIKESEKFRFINQLKNKFKSEGYKIDDLDGVKIIFDDGWALFRPSNTEPKISYVFESATKEGLERLRGFVNKILESVPK